MKKHKNQELYDNASYLEPEFRNSLENYFTNSEGTNVWKLQNFAKYVPRQTLTRFLVRNEIFKLILDKQGSIVELGVLDGGSLMTWAQLSSIYEHLNYQSRVIGFDAFNSEIELSEKDKIGSSLSMYDDNTMAIDSYEDILESIKVYDKNRFLGSINKVELVKGDATKTVPNYLKNNPETIVRLLYLDINLYGPTKIALEKFLPRMPKGSVIIFDEINDHGLPGESMAALEIFDLNKYEIKRFTYDTKISYLVL